MKIKQKELVLILLYGLKKAGLESIKEGGLHIVANEFYNASEPPLKFVKNPILYSDDLIKVLHSLGDSGFVDETFRTYDDFLNIPTYYYTLTAVGITETESLVEKLKNRDEGLLNNILFTANRYAGMFTHTV